MLWKIEDSVAVHSSADELQQELNLRLNDLILLVRKKVSAADVVGRFVQLHRIMAALPLGSDEFSLVVNRLRNAMGYLKINERGAALFELRQLSRSIGQVPG